jgi:hypothetical protein
MAVSSEGETAEVTPLGARKVASEEAAADPREPIDYARVVLSVLQSYGGHGGLDYLAAAPPESETGVAGACAARAEQPVVALLGCRRSRLSRTCLLFTPTALSVHTCSQTGEFQVVTIPWSELPARWISEGRSVTEVSLDRGQSVDASGCSVQAGTVLVVLTRLRNAVMDEQRARGELDPTKVASPPSEIRCPRCKETRLILHEESRGSGAGIAGGLLFGMLGGLVGGLMDSATATPARYTCRDCGFQWKAESD